MENREGVNLALFKRNAVCLSALVEDRKVNLSKGFLFLDQFLKMIINFDSNEGQARAHTQTCLPLYLTPVVTSLTVADVKWRQFLSVTCHCWAHPFSIYLFPLNPLRARDPAPGSGPLASSIL